MDNSIFNMTTCETDAFVAICNDNKLIPIATSSREVLIYLAPNSKIIVLKTVDKSVRTTKYYTDLYSVLITIDGVLF